MPGKKKVRKSLVYRPTKLFVEVDDEIIDLVDMGKYPSYNAAINGLLIKQLKVKVDRYKKLRELQPGDTFKFANNQAYRIYKILEDCFNDTKKKHQTRKCEIVATGQILYIACKKEIIKL